MKKLTNKKVRKMFNIYTNYAPPEWLITIIRKIVLKYCGEVLDELYQKASPINKDIFDEIQQIKKEL